jgi:demethylmenaquinone methyltransferase / 2-methoxy-6-polyprenyl-1,4-benzoquinol methylase
MNRDHVAHEPHRPLLEYYVHESNRKPWVDGIFNETAEDYEKVVRLMDFGSGSRYRHHALIAAGLKSGMRVVDVGTGTGLVAREAALIVGDPALVTGVDPSTGMMAAAQVPSGLQMLEGSAEHIPLPDGCADFISMGYALRHISDLALAFTEFRRVLKPGGRLCILEITTPASRVHRFLMRLYMRGVIPALSRLIARRAQTPVLMRYYWDTIEACVPAEKVIATLQFAGFTEVHRKVQAGMLTEYRALA